MRGGDEVRREWGGPTDEDGLVTLEVDPAQLLAVAALDPGGSVEERRACWRRLALEETRDSPLASRLLDLSPMSVEVLCHLAGEYLRRRAARSPVTAGLTA